MESKITISFDYEQKTPFIKINYKDSDDERDKMVKAFLESMGGDICFTKFQYEQYAPDSNSIAGIRPIPYDNLQEEIKTMQRWVDHVNRGTEGDIAFTDTLSAIELIYRLGVLLADHKHQWSDGDRLQFERVTADLQRKV